MKKIAIFASGSGTNAENLMNYFGKSNKIAVTLLISNTPKAYALKRAEAHKIETAVFLGSDFSDGQVVVDFLRTKSIDFIVLAGFLKLIPKKIIAAYPRRIINLHPALLPKYGGKGMYGMHVHRAVIAAKETESGITIHYVNELYDDGAIIHQKKCDVTPGDTPETLASKIHALEHAEMPKVVERLVTRDW